MTAPHTAPVTAPLPAARPVTVKAVTFVLVGLMIGTFGGAWGAFAFFRTNNWFLLALVSIGAAYILSRCANGVWYGYSNAWQSTIVVAGITAASFGLGMKTPNPVAATGLGLALLVIALLVLPPTRAWCRRPAKGMKERLREAGTARR